MKWIIVGGVAVWLIGLFAVLIEITYGVMDYDPAWDEPMIMPKKEEGEENDGHRESGTVGDCDSQ